MSAQSAKNLLAQDDAIQMLLPEEWNGGVSVWLSANATGTVILEFGSENASNVVEWAQVEMKNPLIAVNADVDSLVGAATPQYGWAEFVGVRWVRARRTDAAGNDCYTTLSFRRT
jgi:hypothetical protein